MLEQVPDTKGGLWTYRRLIDASLFPPGAGFPRDISMINWPGNDYRDQSILDRRRGSRRRRSRTPSA